MELIRIWLAATVVVAAIDLESEFGGNQIIKTENGLKMRLHQKASDEQTLRKIKFETVEPEIGGDQLPWIVSKINKYLAHFSSWVSGEEDELKQSVESLIK